MNNKSGRAAMKRFILWLRFKIYQFKTGCGNCKKCSFRAACKEEAGFSGLECDFCRFNNVCNAELKSGVN